MIVLVAFGLYDIITRILDAEWTKFDSKISATGILLLVSGALYYAPYAIMFTGVSNTAPAQGVSVDSWISSAYSELPQTLNLITVSATIMIGKLFYLVGLRPCYSDVNWPFSLFGQPPV